MTIYSFKGLNFDNFLTQIKKNNLSITFLERTDYNEFKIGVKAKDEKLLLAQASKYNYVIKEFSVPKYKKIFRLVKTNFVFFICAVLILFSLPVFTLFVYKTEVYGLKNVKKDEILSILSQNGFEMGKIKFNYDLGSIEKVIVNNVEGISFASSVIKGNTLVVNVHEKIDTSSEVFDYKPIVAPIDCIIESISLVSGTANKNAFDIAKKGEVIISPSVNYLDEKSLPVPAKGVVVATCEVSKTFFVSDEAKNSSLQNLVEENKKMLYNTLSNLDILDTPYVQVTELECESGCYVTVLVRSKITF